MRDLTAINMEQLTHFKTKFCIDHSKMNIITVDEEYREEEAHVHGCDHHGPDIDGIEQFILEEKNKMIY